MPLQRCGGREYHVSRCYARTTARIAFKLGGELDLRVWNGIVNFGSYSSCLSFTSFYTLDYQGQGVHFAVLFALNPTLLYIFLLADGRSITEQGVVHGRSKPRNCEERKRQYPPDPDSAPGTNTTITLLKNLQNPLVNSFFFLIPRFLLSFK